MIMFKNNIVMGLNPEFIQGHINIVLKYLQPLYISGHHVPKPGQHVSKQLLLGSNSL